MKTALYALAILSLTTTGCSNEKQNPKKKTIVPNSSAAIAEDIDSQLYLNDAIASTAESDASEPESSSENAKKSHAIDPEKLKLISSKLFEFINTNKNTTIEIEEFLAAPRMMFMKENESSAHEKMTKHLSEKFYSFAGSDKLMDQSELASFLSSKLEKVKHRREKHKELHEQRREKLKSELFAKMDMNQDGSISKDEFEAFKKQREERKS